MTVPGVLAGKEGSEPSTVADDDEAVEGSPAEQQLTQSSPPGGWPFRSCQSSLCLVPTAKYSPDCHILLSHGGCMLAPPGLYEYPHPTAAHFSDPLHHIPPRNSDMALISSVVSLYISTALPRDRQRVTSLRYSVQRWWDNHLCPF